MVGVWGEASSYGVYCAVVLYLLDFVEIKINKYVWFNFGLRLSSGIRTGAMCFASY
jgi:hypothetical protein